MPNTIHAQDFPDFCQNNHHEGANNEHVSCLAVIVGYTDYTNDDWVKQSALNNTFDHISDFAFDCV